MFLNLNSLADPETPEHNIKAVNLIPEQMPLRRSPITTEVHQRN